MGGLISPIRPDLISDRRRPPLSAVAALVASFCKIEMEMAEMILVGVWPERGFEWRTRLAVNALEKSLFGR